MIFQFEHVQTVAVEGTNPAAVHLPTNEVIALYLKDGQINGIKATPEQGEWASLIFSTPSVVARDKDVSFLRLKNVPRLGIYGVWHSATPDARHRFAIYELQGDLSKYLVQGVIELRLETPIADLSLTLENPRQVVSGEDRTFVAPGSKIELNFYAGDSELYPMGIYYDDRIEISVTGETASIEGRNISGKLLKDQTFDDANLYISKRYDLTVVDVLGAAGITNYSVQSGAVFDLGMEFPPNMTFLDGVYELLKASRNWAIKETLDGQIIVGSTVSYAPIQVNSKYTFERGKDVWSRQVVRDDYNVYARVCVYDKTFYIYRSVVEQEGWVVAPKKTLYIEVAEGTSEIDMDGLALEVATRIAKSGTLETFVGPWRPHLLPGDEAEIVKPTESRLLGLVTTVRHIFSKSEGFATEFTVDSGGAIGKPQIKELIDSIAQRQSVGGAKRL